MGVGRHPAVKYSLYDLLTNLSWYKLVLLSGSSSVLVGNLWPSAMKYLIDIKSPGQFIKDVVDLIVYYPDYHM